MATSIGLIVEVTLQCAMRACETNACLTGVENTMPKCTVNGFQQHYSLLFV
jgi:hypothetical protein